MNDLKNMNIIVTGATGGIGNSIVKRLIENKANVLASGTKIDKLEILKSNFNSCCSSIIFPFLSTLYYFFVTIH